MSSIKVINQYLTDITWIDASAYDFRLHDHIDVWRVNISSNLSQLDAFLAIITPDELERANRYYHRNDKDRFIVSRGALRIILGKYLNKVPKSIEFEIGQNKKPHIKNNFRLYYNISHSGDWVLLAVSTSEVGADTELINPAYGYQEVLPDNFSHDEISFINENYSISRF